MSDQQGFTQEEVVDIVRTAHNLRVLDDLLRVADTERERLVQSRKITSATLYGHIDLAMTQERYNKELNEGDRRVDEVKAQLRETIDDYRSLPEGMQQEISEIYGIDLDKIEIHLM